MARRASLRVIRQAEDGIWEHLVEQGLVPGGDRRGALNGARRADMYSCWCIQVADLNWIVTV